MMMMMMMMISPLTSEDEGEGQREEDVENEGRGAKIVLASDPNMMNKVDNLATAFETIGTKEVKKVEIKEISDRNGYIDENERRTFILDTTTCSLESKVVA